LARGCIWHPRQNEKVAIRITRPCMSAGDRTKGRGGNCSVVPVAAHKTAAGCNEIGEGPAVDRNLQDSAIQTFFQIEAILKDQISAGRVNE
jgi:hypothetical protein